MSRSLVPEPLRVLPWGVLGPLAALTVFGSLVLYSAAGNRAFPWAAMHLVNFALFLAMAVALSYAPRRLFKSLAYPAYLGLLALLILVELAGRIGGGSQRWLNLGVMTLQPSELMKPVVVLALARFYDDLPPAMIRNWRALLPAGLIIALPALLVVVQPDLGTALAICIGAIGVMFLAGVPWWWFAGGGLAAAAAAPLAYFLVLHDYQRKRVTVFFNPEADMQGAGYHIMQSKIAIGSGGLFGKGLGNGSQSHLEFLPEKESDFAFATMAEEWGVLGGLFILAVFYVVVFRWGMAVARAAPDRFSQLLAAGMVITIFVYVTVNLMMVMGLAPVVGIPLPFISHGGSSMMTNMACIGAIMAVERWRRRMGGASAR